MPRIANLQWIAGRIWEGPFHIGKLVQPVSVGDVLAKLLETAWRLLVILVTGIAVMAAVVIGWSAWLEPIVFPPLAHRIELTARYDDGTVPIISTEKTPFRCSKEYPILVALHNKSRNVIRNTSFSIEANVPGRSSNVLSGGDYISSDVVIQPGYTAQQCFGLPVVAGYEGSTLQYHGSVITASD